VVVLSASPMFSDYFLMTQPNRFFVVECCVHFSVFFSKLCWVNADLRNENKKNADLAAIIGDLRTTFYDLS
jgi:hypothetical protein